MLVTLLGIIKLPVNLSQNVKAPFPILVTLLPIVSEVKFLQEEKAPLPMLITLFGIVTEVNPLQPEKAEAGIFLTSLPIFKIVIDVLFAKLLLPMLKQFIALKSRVAKELQPAKALSPMFSTLSGRISSVKPLQPEKAEAGIFVTSLPIFKIVIALLLEKLLLPMLVQFIALKLRVANALQPEKAEFPILVTLFGIVIEVKPLQPEKAELSMFVTLLPIVSSVNVVFFLNGENTE